MSPRLKREVRYWQERAAFWHRSADSLAECMAGAEGYRQPMLSYKWSLTKSAERSAALYARSLMGLDQWPQV